MVSAAGSHWRLQSQAKSIATARAIKTLQRLKSPLMLQSPPTRTEITSVLIALATAIPRGNGHKITD